MWVHTDIYTFSKKYWKYSRMYRYWSTGTYGENMINGINRLTGKNSFYVSNIRRVFIYLCFESLNIYNKNFRDFAHP